MEAGEPRLSNPVREEQLARSGYPTSFDQLSEFLQVKLSEPCNSGASQGTHQSFIFLEEMVGNPAQEKFTGSALNGVIYQEPLSSAQAGKPAKQATRMLSQMLAFLEQQVMDETSPFFMHVYSSWMPIGPLFCAATTEE